MSRRKISKKTITQWHRKIGITSAIFVLFMTVTGWLIHRSDLFNFQNSYVQSTWLLKLYGVYSGQPLGVQLGDDWVSGLDGQIYINTQKVADCSGRFVGAAGQNNITLVVCESEAMLLSGDDAQLIDRQILPRVSALGRCLERLCARAESGLYYLDTDLLELTEKLEHAADYSEIAVTPLPERLESAIIEANKSQVISWERVLLDVHAGRFLGKLGAWIMDIVALVFLILAVSGIWLWARKLR